MGELWKGLDQSVMLATVAFLLQLEQDIFPVHEECVDNHLGIMSSGDAAGKESIGAVPSSDLSRQLAVHYNGLSICQGFDLIDAAYCFGPQTVAISGKLKSKYTLFQKIE